MDSHQQGLAFETLFSELVGRVLSDDLGFDVLMNSVQPSGPQYGKDIQFQWVDPSSGEVYWHVECKSHAKGVIHQREVADKVLDAARSAHRIDVWCLAIAHVEPSTATDELLAYANTQMALPFHVTVISRDRYDIRSLFALHPDLFSQLYPDEPCPSLEPDERDAITSAFSDFLRTATNEGKQRLLRPTGEWTLVSPSRISELPDSPQRASAFLRGLTPECPWEAIVHDWAVRRRSTEDRLESLVIDAPLGFSAVCLRGAGGEGKSTVLKRVAWNVATSDTHWHVLFASSTFADDRFGMPADWILALPEGSNVLLCVDGGWKAGGSARVARLGEELVDAAKRVVLLVADRGNDWWRSPIRRDLRKARASRALTTRRLAPLVETEQEALVAQLRDRGLLYGRSPEAAASRIAEACKLAESEGDESYLLPILLQLTDPENRAFETILEDLLSDLQQTDDGEAADLLLAVALVHAAREGLDVRLAERLAGGASRLSVTRAILDSELQATLSAGLPRPFESDRTTRLFTHHSVVAQGLLDVAYEADDLRNTLLTVCMELPKAIEPDVDDVMLVPRDLFAVLDSVATMLEKERGLYEAGAALLESWAGLDSRIFPTVHRLAECRLRWLQSELAEDEIDWHLVDLLAQSAHSGYLEVLEIAGTTLENEDTPPPLAHFTVREVESATYHARANLENTLGRNQQSAEDARPFLLRACFLLFLSFEPGSRKGLSRQTQLLADVLLNLQDAPRAGVVAQSARELGARQGVANRQLRTAQDQGYTLRQTGLSGLDQVLSDLAEGPLLAEWEAVGLYSERQEHVDALQRCLVRISDWFPDSSRVAEAKLALGG